MTDTDRLAGLAALLDNRQMPDDATPNVTMGDLRALRAAILAPTLPDARHLEPPITVSYLYAMLAHIEAIHPVEGICYGRGDCATVYGMPAPTPPDALLEAAQALTKFEWGRNGQGVCSWCGWARGTYDSDAHGFDCPLAIVRAALAQPKEAER